MASYNGVMRDIHARILVFVYIRGEPRTPKPRTHTCNKCSARIRSCDTIAWNVTLVHRMLNVLLKSWKPRRSDCSCYRFLGLRLNSITSAEKISLLVWKFNLSPRSDDKYENKKNCDRQDSFSSRGSGDTFVSTLKCDDIYFYARVCTYYLGE